MSLITLQEALDFIGVTDDFITVTAGSNTLYLLYTGGTSVACAIVAGTYDITSFLVAVKTAIDTGCTCTSTVTYSDTTKKITIDAGSGKTFTYTHTNSTAGVLLGFNQNHSAARTITSDVAVGSPTAMASNILTSVEAWIENIYCRRTFASTSYRERYDTGGSNAVVLRKYPIISVDRLSLGDFDIITVSNNTKYHCTVSTTSTGVVLTKNGVSTTLLYADYATMTLMVGAINAQSADGWSATLRDTNYSLLKSSDLIYDVSGIYCGDSSEIDLAMLDPRAQYDFNIDLQSGIVYLTPYGYKYDEDINIGSRSIYINYTAGYVTIPEDLKLAVKILVEHIYQRRSEESFGLASYSIGGIGQSFEREGIPVQARLILDGYIKVDNG